MHFMGSNFDVYFASVTAVMYAMSYHIRPCYNGTWLYHTGKQTAQIVSKLYPPTAQSVYVGAK